MKIKTIQHFLIIILTIVTFFCPFFIYKNAKYNVSFAITCLIAFFYIFICIKKTQTTRKLFPFIILFIIYFLIFTITSILHIGCYTEMINRLCCFSFFVVLYKYGDTIFTKKLLKQILNITLIAVVFSILLYFLNIEELSFGNGINYRIQGDHFIDKRLTYVFLHKSTYGLILNLLLIICMRFKNVFSSIKRQYIYILIIFLAIILTGSATAIISSLIIAFAFYICDNRKKINKRKLAVIAICIIVAPFIFTYLFNFLETSRNLSTGGTRFEIWATAFDYLSKNNIGLGDKFFITYIGKFNNFHNVFLNEMLHFSIPIGVMFLIIFIYITIISIKAKKGEKLINTLLWIAIYLLLMIDHSLNISMLPMFFLLIYIIYFYKEEDDINE